MIQRLLFLLVGSYAVTPNLHPIKCINYYGFETPRKRPVCDWVHEPEFYLRTLREYMDINTIRLPFSYELIRNNDFTGMDSFISTTSNHNIQIILDYHRTWASHQGPQPIEQVNVSQIAHVWYTLAQRYVDNPYVIGMGIFNEYQGQNKTYLNLYHKTIINYVEKHFPGRYYYFVGCATWGHDCNDIIYTNPNISSDRIMVDFHTYHFIYDSIQNNNIEQTLDMQLPHTISTSNILIGEIGWKQDVQEERDWAQRTLNYLKARNITSVCGWTIAHSGDTGGWWNDDCLTFRYDKADVLKSLWDTTPLPPPTPTPCACSCPTPPQPSWSWPWIPHRKLLRS